MAVSWDEEVERILGELERDRVDRAHLCGYSLGGRVAWGLLVRAPERFERATLIGAHPGLRTAREREERAKRDARWLEMLERDGIDAFLDAWEALPLFATQTSDQRAAQRAIRETHGAFGLAHALRALGLAQMPPVDPSHIGNRVTLVVGEHDREHRRLAEPFVGQLALGSLEVVAGAGHNVLVERPDALAAILGED